MSVQITTLNNKVEALANLRKDRDRQFALVQGLREKLELSIQAEVKALEKLNEGVKKYQEEILEAMKGAGTKSWKTEHASVARKISTTYKVADEKKFVDDLTKRNLKKLTKVTYTPEAVGFIKEAMDKEGYLFDGVEKTDKEYISVLLAKEKNENS